MLSIAQLKELQEVLKLSALVKKAGLTPATIQTKISRNTELTVTESEAIVNAMDKCGLCLKKQPQKRRGIKVS